MDLSFVTNLSPTLQAVISIIAPLVISLIPGIILATTALKKLPTGPKIIGAVSTIIGTLLFQLILVGVLIYMQWFELPSIVMMFFGGVAMKALIGVIQGLLGPSATAIPVVPTVGGKRRRR